MRPLCHILANALDISKNIVDLKTIVKRLIKFMGERINESSGLKSLIDYLVSSYFLQRAETSFSITVSMIIVVASFLTHF